VPDLYSAINNSNPNAPTVLGKAAQTQVLPGKAPQLTGIAKVPLQ
jgi:hypothetical protein